MSRRRFVFAATGEFRAVEALFDTGASKSLIRRDVARRVGRLLRSPTAWTFQLGDGKGRLTTNEMVGLFFQLKGVPIAHTFIVARHLSEEVIIGTDLIQFWKIRPDPVREDRRHRQETHPAQAGLRRPSPGTGTVQRRGSDVVRVLSAPR